MGVDNDPSRSGLQAQLLPLHAPTSLPSAQPRRCMSVHAKLLTLTVTLVLIFLAFVSSSGSKPALSLHNPVSFPSSHLPTGFTLSWPLQGNGGALAYFKQVTELSGIPIEFPNQDPLEENRAGSLNAEHFRPLSASHNQEDKAAAVSEVKSESLNDGHHCWMAAIAERVSLISSRLQESIRSVTYSWRLFHPTAEFSGNRRRKLLAFPVGEGSAAITEAVIARLEVPEDVQGSLQGSVQGSDMYSANADVAVAIDSAIRGDVASGGAGEAGEEVEFVESVPFGEEDGFLFHEALDWSNLVQKPAVRSELDFFREEARRWASTESFGVGGLVKRWFRL
eukprot:TRINITY_DN38497_c0_g1_i1.p1 TRINITY_DN38497_c0_g1~~TRINITY_DN38497_c0_g1_i1.p1  ORF type:complete len:337 (+),score=41.16 TRINITY_DN38497_c0_g1_i1:480-1490(+)